MTDYYEKELEIYKQRVAFVEKFTKFAPFTRTAHIGHTY